MLKVQRLSQFQHSFSFSSSTDQFDTFYSRFLESDLGKIYLAVPWEGLVNDFNLKDSEKGPDSIFSPMGKIALMFLKNYASCSDQKLIEQLNGNLEYQFFCDIYLGMKRITNFKIVSDIRCELARTLDIENSQQTLFDHWSNFIEDKKSLVVDATCYESSVRYPTDVKLLWESVDWLYRQMQNICKENKIRLPRTKYLKWQKRYLSYAKMRRKTKKKRITITRSLLMLVAKIDGLLDEIETEVMHKLSRHYIQRRVTIKEVFQQQHAQFHDNIKPTDRIVSLDKPYIRPIVRGKEIKGVEFGAKLNKFQVDGISFIEHLSFDAFHEGNRFQETIFKAQRLTKTRTKIIGADGIYATNKNRRFASKLEIQTDFKRKGRAGKHEKQRKQLAAAITKERASRLEGSFGKDKAYYYLNKIKARTKETETLWIFFGIHAGNALEIGRRMVVTKNHIAA